ncbi:hypothetical protein Sj15T_05500 [Sphingobium sp. TA15]|nr:hypothetical protein Sj15T_05500 [Sphingobium sp. TA15]
MFLISGPDLVVESCRAGVVGSFPAFNQRTPAGYEEWLKEIRGRLQPDDAPWATQFSVHPSNTRLDEDVALTVKYEVPILISSAGITREVTDAIHAYGGLCFHDAINIRHAKKALDANVDGIIAVAGGAGGHSGTYNPLAFLGELKPIMGDKTLVLAGCIGDGSALAGAIAAGADLGYIGTRFINTIESTASDKLKQMVMDSDITDIVYSAEVDGIGGSWLKQTIPAKGHFGEITPSKFDIDQVLGEPKRWKDILSAGQGVGPIQDIVPAAELIGQFEREFDASIDRIAAMKINRSK